MISVQSLLHNHLEMPSPVPLCKFYEKLEVNARKLHSNHMIFVQSKVLASVQICPQLPSRDSTKTA